jgi:hypothetical protein
MAFENDWVFLQAALPDLQRYILSKDLYWPLTLPARAPHGVKIPQLTIGNVLLSEARLAALSLESAQLAELAGYATRIEQVRKDWRANWGRKTGQEHTSRLNLWRQYLRELRTDSRANAAFYTNEVRHRAILRLLLVEILDVIPQNDAEQINQLDEMLRMIAQPGPFVWELEVESAFPRDGFWFLYLDVRK